MKWFAIVSFLILTNAYLIYNAPLQAQISTFVDSRDQAAYQTIVIGNRIWFRENLKLETNNSHCPNFNKKEGDCDKGNYYPYQELSSLCPEGWRVATLSDWEDYIQRLVDLNQAKQEEVIQIEIDTLSHWADMETEASQHQNPNLFSTVSVQVNSDSFNVYRDKLLHLENLHWVEGRKVKKKRGVFTLWINHKKLNNPRYHVHIGTNKYIKHIHKHNVDDRPAKTRKFGVRCVCDIK